jgi:hypothetical protein
MSAGGCRITAVPGTAIVLGLILVSDALHVIECPRFEDPITY